MKKGINKNTRSLNGVRRRGTSANTEFMYRDLTVPRSPGSESDSKPKPDTDSRKQLPLPATHAHRLTNHGRG
jgi:hypothetical protein